VIFGCNEGTKKELSGEKTATGRQPSTSNKFEVGKPKERKETKLRRRGDCRKMESVSQLKGGSKGEAGPSLDTRKWGISSP